MSHWMEPKSRVVVLTPLQIRQHRQSLQTAEIKLEEVRARAGKSPGPTTRKVIRDLETHIEHTKALLGEKKYVAHRDGTDEFLGPVQKKQKPAAAAIKNELLPNLEKHPEPVVETPAPRVEKSVAPGNAAPAIQLWNAPQLALDLNLPEPPKSIFKGSLKNRLKSLNGGKKAI